MARYTHTSAHSFKTKKNKKATTTLEQTPTHTRCLCQFAVRGETLCPKDRNNSQEQCGPGRCHWLDACVFLLICIGVFVSECVGVTKKRGLDKCDIRFCYSTRQLISGQFSEIHFVFLILKNCTALIPKVQT